MPMTEDFGVFTAPHDFATQAEYGGHALNVILDVAPASPFGDALVDADATTIQFASADAPGMAEGDTVAIGNISYTVARGVVVDASGWATATLYPQS